MPTLGRKFPFGGVASTRRIGLFPRAVTGSRRLDKQWTKVNDDGNARALTTDSIANTAGHFLPEVIVGNYLNLEKS
jgi:hypothetical protein